MTKVHEIRAAQTINAIARERMLLRGIDMNDITENPLSTLPDTPDPMSPQTMPLSLSMLFDDKLFERVQAVAEFMAKAQGYTPRHLLGKVHACFWVVQTAFAWRLDPMYVARNTYETPGGQIGNQGALVNAIVEQSGRLEPRTGAIRFEFTGNWPVIDAKPHEIRESKKVDADGKAKEYAARTWTRDDALKSKAGVTMRARLRNERQDREFSMYLYQAFPLNSTLWATDPRTQLVYLATRRFVNLCMPSVLGGFVDPMNDMPTSEVDMGAADVVHEHVQKEETESPLGGVTTPEPPRQQKEEQADSGAPVLVTASALKIIMQKLSDRELHERFCKEFGIADPAELPMAKVNNALAWISQQAKDD